MRRCRSTLQAGTCHAASHDRFYTAEPAQPHLTRHARQLPARGNNSPLYHRPHQLQHPRALGRRQIHKIPAIWYAMHHPHRCPNLCGSNAQTRPVLSTFLPLLINATTFDARQAAPPGLGNLDRALQSILLMNQIAIGNASAWALACCWPLSLLGTLLGCGNCTPPPCPPP